VLVAGLGGGCALSWIPEAGLDPRQDGPVNETRWSLLGVRLELLRDLVGWIAAVALGVGAICSYAAVQDLRRAYQGQTFHPEWYRYVAGAVQGAGIPLLVAGMMLSLAVLLTAGIRVTSAFGESTLDDEDSEDDAQDDADDDAVDVDAAE